MMYFYDSYALIAYFRRSEAYKPYFERHIGITSSGNLLEVFYAFLREENVASARAVLHALLSIVVEPAVSDIEPAMLMKHKHKERKLSYTDCLGYVLAKRHGCKFLTGDEDFRGMRNVEFVKA